MESISKQAVRRLAERPPSEVRSQRTEDRKAAVKEKKKGLSVADKKLLARGNRIQKTEDRSQKRPGKKVLSVADKKLLARVVGYYQHSFTEDQPGGGLSEEPGDYKQPDAAPTSARALSTAA
jgi:hypothetical protein